MKTIQVLKPVFRVDETLEQIRECLNKGWSGIGFKTAEFEEIWRSGTGYKNAHFLNSATAGLHLALKVAKDTFKWADGDEIITTPMTFVSTNHVILYESMAPIFADVDQTLCMTPQSVLKNINSRTRALIFVGLGGNAANYKAIRQICKERGIFFILDAAHMAGTMWLLDNGWVGLDSDCSVYSFQAVKNCPSSDAGMLCFQNTELDRFARKLSWLGIDKSTYDRYSESFYKWKYDVSDLGYKYNGNSITAAMCIVSFKYLEEDNRKRRNLALVYSRHLIQSPKLQIVHHDADVLSSRHLYQIIVSDRDGLIDFLAKKNIYCGVHYTPNNRYKIYRQDISKTPISEHYGDHVISLPLHLGLSEADVAEVARCIMEY